MLLCIEENDYYISADNMAPSFIDCNAIAQTSTDLSIEQIKQEGDCLHVSVCNPEEITVEILLQDIKTEEIQRCKDTSGDCVFHLSPNLSDIYVISLVLNGQILESKRFMTEQ